MTCIFLGNIECRRTECIFPRGRNICAKRRQLDWFLLEQARKFCAMLRVGIADGVGSFVVIFVFSRDGVVNRGCPSAGGFAKKIDYARGDRRLATGLP